MQTRRTDDNDMHRRPGETDTQLLARIVFGERYETSEPTCGFCGAVMQEGDNWDECGHPEGQGGAAGTLDA